jgi:hypothetical protein
MISISNVFSFLRGSPIDAAEQFRGLLSEGSVTRMIGIRNWRKGEARITGLLPTPNS